MGCCGSAPYEYQPRYNTQPQQAYEPQARENQVAKYQQPAADRYDVAAEFIQECGFSVASEDNKAVLLHALSFIKPTGMTALRDVIELSVTKLLAIKVILNRLQVTGHQFIHIVLTDGSDTSSRNSLKDIQQMYYTIGQKLGDEYLKTYFVGINLDYADEQELQSIANLASGSAELFNCSDVNLSDVFERIKLSLGIQRRVAVATNGQYWAAARQDQVYLQAQRQKFLVLFDLDMSGSMSGMRWTRLQRALAGFFTALNDYDIIGCILFNHDCVCMTGKPLDEVMN